VVIIDGYFLRTPRETRKVGPNLGILLIEKLKELKTFKNLKDRPSAEDGEDSEECQF
jgi:hypothetical protein